MGWCAICSIGLLSVDLWTDGRDRVSTLLFLCSREPQAQKFTHSRLPSFFGDDGHILFARLFRLW